MAREQGTKSSWNFLSWFYPSGPGRGFRGICGFGSAGRRTRYKKVIKCGERVCISTHLSGSRSLFFSFSANTPGEAAVEIWFTVLGNYGTCPNTRWLKLEFASRRAAGVDALDGGKILHLREPSLMCTIWYALSPRWRSKQNCLVLIHETWRQNICQLDSPAVVDCEVPVTWTYSCAGHRLLALVLTSRVNMILGSFCN